VKDEFERYKKRAADALKLMMNNAEKVENEKKKAVLLSTSCSPSNFSSLPSSQLQSQFEELQKRYDNLSNQVVLNKNSEMKKLEEKDAQIIFLSKLKEQEKLEKLEKEEELVNLKEILKNLQDELLHSNIILKENKKKSEDELTIIKKKSLSLIGEKDSLISQLQGRLNQSEKELMNYRLLYPNIQSSNQNSKTSPFKNINTNISLSSSIANTPYLGVTNTAPLNSSNSSSLQSPHSPSSITSPFSPISSSPSSSSSLFVSSSSSSSSSSSLMYSDSFSPDVQQLTSRLRLLEQELIKLRKLQQKDSLDLSYLKNVILKVFFIFFFFCIPT
jgi:hypothetical protein